jgi:adenylate cyclase
VAELVRERTGGNPFFIQEVIQGLFEEGGLAGRRGAYELARTIGEVRIPATVQAVLAARIDRLSEREKTLLQAAAVIGRQFTGSLAGRVAGLVGDELQTALQALVEGEFVFETAAYPELEYLFKHALTEEVAYRSQLTRRRARTHATVAEALTELNPDRLDERAALIAHHYEAGGTWLEAARWHARAAGWAGFSNPVMAARHCRRVRQLTGELEPSPETIELGIAARLQLLSLHWRLGTASEEGQIRFEDEAATLFAEAEVLADTTGQPEVKAFVLMSYSGVQLTTDAVEEGYELSVRATRLADETGDRAARVVGRLGAWGLFVLGRVQEAAAVIGELLEIIGDDHSIGRGLVTTSPYAWGRLQLAHLSTYSGRLDDGLVAVEEAIEIAGKEGDLEVQAWGRRFWAVLADLAGADPGAAAVHADQALQWAEEAGGAWSQIFNREGVAISHAQRAEWHQAIQVVNEALAIARDRRLSLADVAFLLSIRARAQTGQGDLGGARSSSEEAIAVAVRCGTRFYEAQARHQLARAVIADLAAGEDQRARAELDHALSIVQALGIRVYAPHLHLEFAHLARAVGDEAGCERSLRRARDLFLEVGAPARAEEVASLTRSR